MYVEDVLADIAGRTYRFDDPIGEFLRSPECAWHKRFIENVHTYASQGRPLSSQQSKVFLKFISDIQPTMVQIGYTEHELFMLLKHPVHRLTPYKSSVVPKQVRYLGDNKLGFRFKMDENILREIRNLAKIVRDDDCQNDHHPYFDRVAKIWVVSITEETLEPVMKIISMHNFNFDDEVTNYLTLCSNSIDEPATFVWNPEDNTFIVNVCANEFLSSWMRRVMFAENI